MSSTTRQQQLVRSYGSSRVWVTSEVEWDLGKMMAQKRTKG